MQKTTPLIIQHQLAGAKLIDFSGWQMPLHYGSQLQEHHAVRSDVGMFDVSHMAIVAVQGPQAQNFLRYLLANDVNKIQPRQALYTCMLNAQGGIIDDLIVYQLDLNHYRLVLNAGTREKDWLWLQTQQKLFEVNLTQRHDLGIIAVQGPNAVNKISVVLNEAEQDALKQIRPFQGMMINEVFFSRTGYTGEDGFELQIPADQINTYWHKFLSVGVQPCGLGARDTLRLEAGLNLYGIDMDESTTPLESNLSWTVAFEPGDRNFIGRSSLEQQRQTSHKQMVGLILESPGVLRGHQKVLMPNQAEGEITSGTFSPTLGYAIALARVPFKNDSHTCEVEIRQKKVTAQIVRPPFVRKGQKVYKTF